MPECNDKRCPEHGSISVRGNVFTGVVVSAKPLKTAVVEREIVRYIPKYERYRKQSSRIYAHNPTCIDAKENDIVRVAETRKLSKTKSFVVLEVIGKKKVIGAEEERIERVAKEEKAPVNEREEAAEEEDVKDRKEETAKGREEAAEEEKEKKKEKADVEEEKEKEKKEEKAEAGTEEKGEESQEKGQEEAEKLEEEQGGAEEAEAGEEGKKTGAGAEEK